MSFAYSNEKLGCCGRFLLCQTEKAVNFQKISPIDGKGHVETGQGFML